MIDIGGKSSLSLTEDDFTTHPSVTNIENNWSSTDTFTLDFLKVVRLVFWSGVVGPGTNDFYPLQRAKFTGGIFLL